MMPVNGAQCTCVSALRQIHKSLQCKSSSTVHLGQYSKKCLRYLFPVQDWTASLLSQIVKFSVCTGLIFGFDSRNEIHVGGGFFKNHWNIVLNISQFYLGLHQEQSVLFSPLVCHQYEPKVICGIFILPHQSASSPPLLCTTRTRETHDKGYMWHFQSVSFPPVSLLCAAAAAVAVARPMPKALWPTSLPHSPPGIYIFGFSVFFKISFPICCWKSV